jgi:hypothetical protein
VLPSSVDQGRVLAEAADYFHLAPAAVQAAFETYRGLHEAKGYAMTFGEARTLNFEEAFLLYLSAAQVRPAQVVEIGSQYGKSTRRILDLLASLDLDAPVTCFDVVDELQYVGHDEINLVLNDVTNTVTADILKPLAPSLIYLDAHPYSLVRNVVKEFIAWSQEKRTILAIHDCGPALYNPHMWIGKEDFRLITSKTGVWERYALGEVFGASPAAVDDIRTPTHRLRVFSTRHGLALLAPHAVLAATPAP